LRLVVSIAKKRVTPDQKFFELVFDGNVSLLRVAEKFDFSRSKKVQHLRQLGDHEKLRSHDPERVMAAAAEVPFTTFSLSLYSQLRFVQPQRISVETICVRCLQTEADSRNDFTSLEYSTDAYLESTIPTRADLK